MPNGLLFDELCVYQALKVGSVDPFGHREFMVRLSFIYGFNGCLQVGPRVQRDLPELVAGHKLVAEIEQSGYIELFNRSPIVHQCEQLNLRVAQIYFGGLQRPIHTARAVVPTCPDRFARCRRRGIDLG